MIPMVPLSHRLDHYVIAMGFSLLVRTPDSWHSVDYCVQFWSSIQQCTDVYFWHRANQFCRLPKNKHKHTQGNLTSWTLQLVQIQRIRIHRHLRVKLHPANPASPPIYGANTKQPKFLELDPSTAVGHSPVRHRRLVWKSPQPKRILQAGDIHQMG